MAKIEFKTLEQFMPYWCQKILPAVYDDSLSYYQLLGRILQKYNEVIEIVNKHSETLVDHENRITAAEAQIELNRQAIEALKAELAKLDEQVKQNTANIVTLTGRVNQHDADILALQNAVKALQGNNSDWRASVILSGTNIHEMRFVGTGKEIKFSEWGDFIRGGNVVFPVINEGDNEIVGTVAVKITASGIFNAYGCVIEDAHLHYSTATYSAVGHTVAYGKTTDWTEVELLDITNIKQSLGTGEYDVISQKVLTQILNGKLSVDMGITGATAGSYINIAEVDAQGKPIKFGFGTPGGGGAGVDVVQTTGQSTTSVMSQKATTDELEKKTDISLGMTGATVNQNIRVKSVSDDGKPTGWETYTPSTPTADVSLGITGAETGDMAVVKTTTSGGKPNSWSPISTSELAQTLNASIIDLGDYDGYAPEPASANESFTFPMPSAWIGKTRQYVINMLKTQRFRIRYHRVYTAYNVDESADVILSNGGIISEKESTGVLNVFGSTWGFYSLGCSNAGAAGTSKRVCRVGFMTLDSQLSATITASDMLTCLISADIIN